MAKFKVIDQDSYEPDKGTVLDQEDIVDRDGYRDTQTQVMEMIYAGERLNQFRREEYDYEEQVQDFELDPTRAQDFDAIDAQKIMYLESQRLKALKEKREAEAKEKVSGDKVVVNESV